MTPTTLRLLQDIGSVQALDGAEHRHRKQLFMHLASDESIARLGDAFDRAWVDQTARWGAAGEIVLKDASREILTQAVYEWAGVTISREEIPQRSREFGSMIDGAGAVGPKVVKGLALRRRTERWCTDLVEQVRSGDLVPAENCPLAKVALHRDPEGELLPSEVAAVEVINLLRATVAVSNYITHAALALHSYPDKREWLSLDIEGRVEPFVLELRRFYPFFPFVGGRAVRDLSWQGNEIPEGSWVILDVYGTHRDRRTWEYPEEFVPERFVGWEGSPYTLIPQGAGDFYTGHRCPGEWFTIEIMKRTVSHLLGMNYAVPPQKLGVRLSDFPALPGSRFKLQLREA